MYDDQKKSDKTKKADSPDPDQDSQGDGGVQEPNPDERNRWEESKDY